MKLQTIDTALLAIFAAFVVASFAFTGCPVGTGIIGRALSQDVAPEVEAEPDPAVDAELALAIAAVAMNEAPGFPADELLIWQATRAHGSTSAERLAWLRAHSSCVLTDRPMTSYEVRAGNCRWTRHLAEERVEGVPPAGWPSHWRWSGRWERIWTRTIEHAERMVADERPSHGWPCAETPLTWGGDLDAHGALERGLRPVVCVDHRTGRPTENTGYRRASQR